LASPAIPLVSEFKPFPKTSKGLRRELAEHGAQKLMGHADPGVTLRIYARFPDEEIDNGGVTIIDSLWRKSVYLIF